MAVSCCTLKIQYIYAVCIILFVLIEILNSTTFPRFTQAWFKGLHEPCIPFPEEDVCRQPCALATSKGYPCEDVTVQTKDGFLLGMHHISHGRNQNGSTLRRRHPVFLQHGLLSSSFDWVANLANESLAFILADEGYDVWLGNFRGNTYSRRHVKYSPEESEFWAWSWDEMVTYDLPAMFDHVLNTTGFRQLYYIGHSQGTLTAFAGFSKFPELAAKVRLFFALAPVSTISHIESPIKLLAYITPELHELFRILGVREFLPSDELIRFLGSSLCEMFTKFVCSDVIFVICGFDENQLNATRLPVYLAHTPAGTSVQNIVHFAQMVRSGEVQSYDYGSRAENEKHYGQPTAPLYDVSAMKVPSYLYYSTSDWLADWKDVKSLLAKLPNIQGSYQIPYWDHLDFLWGLNARVMLYDPLVRILRNDSDHH